MACEKNTEQMKDVSPGREDSTKPTIAEQPGTTMINDTATTSDAESPTTDTADNNTAAPEQAAGPAQTDAQKKGRRKDSNAKRMPNALREFRIEQMMSKAELARKAGLSVLTIDRIEKGFGCRMDTKRKILKALGLKLSDRRKLFQEE